MRAYTELLTDNMAGAETLAASDTRLYRMVAQTLAIDGPASPAAELPAGAH